VSEPKGLCQQKYPTLYKNLVDNRVLFDTLLGTADGVNEISNKLGFAIINGKATVKVDGTPVDIRVILKSCHTDKNPEDQENANYIAKILIKLNSAKPVVPEPSPAPAPEPALPLLPAPAPAPPATPIELDVLEPIPESYSKPRETKKQCGPTPSAAQEERDILEPITVPGKDEVHKKNCGAPLPQKQGNVQVPEIKIPPFAPVKNIDQKQDDVIIGNVQVPEISHPLVLKKPTSVSVKPTDDSRPLIYGEPKQGPLSASTDPSELYRRTRSQLRRTGRNLGARRK
jgi:hypothetical protein